MAVYRASLASLAEYISDTRLEFTPIDVRSTTGYRENGTRYKISAHKIKCNGICIKNDCFIDSDGNVFVISYVPMFRYWLITNELSTGFVKEEHSSFEFKADSQVLKYKIDHDTCIKSYDDFEKCVNSITEYIAQCLGRSINDFNGNEWEIEDVACDIKWQVGNTKVV